VSPPPQVCTSMCLPTCNLPLTVMGQEMRLHRLCRVFAPNLQLCPYAERRTEIPQLPDFLRPPRNFRSVLGGAELAAGVQAAASSNGFCWEYWLLSYAAVVLSWEATLCSWQVFLTRGVLGF
jgi:hypothetical protein